MDNGLHDPFPTTCPGKTELTVAVRMKGNVTVVSSQPISHAPRYHVGTWGLDDFTEAGHTSILSTEHPSPGPTGQTPGLDSGHAYSLGSYCSSVQLALATGVTDGLGTGWLSPQRGGRVKVKKMTEEINGHMTSMSNR